MQLIIGFIVIIILYQIFANSEAKKVELHHN